MILDEKLFNNRVLTEKFSSTMPKWLRDRIVFTDESRKLSYDASAKDKYRKMGFDVDNQTNVHYTGRGNWDSLFDGFRRVGIDLDSAEFLNDGSIPTSNRDPRLKDPYIPIYYLTGENPYSGKKVSQVYAKGINDNEICEFEPGDKKLGYISAKTLLNHCEGFCCIDTSNANNYQTKGKQRERAQRNVDRQNNPFRRWTPEEQKAYKRRNYNSSFDKSGYLKDPNYLIDKLRDYKAKNPAKTLEKLYKRLSNIKNDFAQVYLNTDINDYETDPDYRDVFDGYSSLNMRLQNIISDYNNFVTSINSVLNDDTVDDDRKSRRITNYFDSYFTRINNNINDLEKSAERVLSVDLDWD